MSRRKVVKRKRERPVGTESVADGERCLQQVGEAGEGGDELKRFWRDLLTDVSRVILSAHEADPHRFDEQQVDQRKKSLGLAIGLLIGGGALLVTLVKSVVG